MNFNEYQDATDVTAIYPDAGQGTWNALSYVGLGLGEAGEIQGKLKKVIRDDGGIISEEKTEAILGEMGDVLWYLARLASELGLSLETVAEYNIEKLYSRLDRGVIGGSGDNR